LSKQLAKDTILYGGADMIIKIISFFTFPILLNLLKVDEFGVITLVSTWAGFVAMFMNLGINNAVQRYYFDVETSHNARKYVVSTGLWLLCVWALILTLVVSTLSYPFGGVLQKRYAMTWNYFALSLLAMIPTQIITYCNDTIRLHFKPIKFLILSLIKNLVAIIAGIVVLKYFDGGIAGYLWVNFLAPLCFIPLGIFLIKKDIIFTIDKTWAKKILSFGYPFVFAGLAYWLFGSMDRWLLAELSTNIEVGLYSVAFKIGSLITFVISAFAQAWSPMAIKLMNEEKETYKIEFIKFFNIFSWVLVLAGVTLCLFAKEFYVYTSPEEYWEAADATVWVVFGLVISGTTQLTAIGVSISKKTTILSKIAWITAIINLILNYILIPQWGCTGSAIATAITYIILTSLYYYNSQLLHPLPFNLNYTILLFSGYFLICLMATYLNQYDSLRITYTKIIVFLLVIFVAIYTNRSLIITTIQQIKHK
jgi:O-antigen/teichoic acid export membrane protein